MNKPSTSSAERVRLHRWVNRTEELADQLLDHLKSGPKPPPRLPVIDPELVSILSELSIDQDDQVETDYPNIRFLELGNGHQAENKERALSALAKLEPEVEVLDRRTVRWGKWGVCHFAAYTHSKGAMISTPKRDGGAFGGADWHKRDRIVLFRDAGNGQLIVYICPTKPLFSMRTIGQHGVTWENISKSAEHQVVYAAADALSVTAT
ncbi:MAG: hypothetical protein KKH72_07750 [Alphaproteobacteria bacterium]|nr:hypothetical protein [Alphaproteobacteria bacterium]